MNSEFDITEEISEENLDEELKDNKLTAYDIAVFYNTYNLSTLLKWWGEKLVVPKFQRSYVWGQRQASEFVDSMLRGLPVPSMFFYDDVDNHQYLVIDGQQRLTSLYRYIVEQKFDDKKFKLIGNIHQKWSGKAYDDLEQEEKDRLQDALINITVMRQLLPDDGQSSMYLAFQRINTGGITLKAQEIRMAVSYGSLAKMLDELSVDPFFDKFKFLRTDTQRKNNNYASVQEFILKVWAYYFRRDDLLGSSSRAFLDNFFADQRYFDLPKRRDENKEYYSEDDFKEVINSVIDDISVLSEAQLSPYTKPTQTFLESIWVGLAYRRLVLKKDVNRDNLGNYIQNWKNVIGDDKFRELFQARRTSSMKAVDDRIKAALSYFEGDF